ncbi:MAG: heparan-alpha-glucosaminide N-acetyltransferase domain-containing protein [Actinomycetota bacterium]
MAAELGQTRLVSLDVFRGITIAGMVLVNNPGTWDAIYPPLEHAEWHGLTPTDLVFPFFLFIVGVSISLALGKRTQEGITRDVYLKIFRRSILIFLIGTFLHLFPYFGFDNFPAFDLSNWRIPGVLQRIAVCYLFASLIFLHTNWKQLTIISIILLIFYWLLMTIVPVPDCAVTTIDDKACNLAAYVDRTVFGLNHIWKQAKVYDPEGLLSTIPAVVTTLAGVLTGLWLKTKRSDLEKVSSLFFFGIVLLVAGWIWNPFFPFNKALWTSSYVVFTAGLALCFLGFCYWLIDIKGYRAWAKPFVIFGANAMALFVGSGLMERIMGIIKVTGAEGEQTNLQDWIYTTVFARLADPQTSSLMFAICFILVWLFLMWLLYRKRIYIKV